MSTEDRATLATIESRVQAQVATRLTDITNGYGAYLAATVRDTTAASGAELVSATTLNTTLTTVLSAAQSRTESIVRAGYRAGAAAGHASAAAELAAAGYTVAAAAPADTAYLTAILGALTAAFLTARHDITESVRAAYDSIAGTPGEQVSAARILVVHRALDRAVRRLGVRVRSAATVAVNRGYTDAQLAAYNGYARDHPSAAMRKEWVAAGPNPCPACRALHGTVIAGPDEFDHRAGESDTFRALPVFGNLLGPPRHPHCRCRLVYRPDPAGAKVRTVVAAGPPEDTPTRLSAAEVRAIPRPRFDALAAFFTATARRLTTLLQADRRG